MSHKPETHAPNPQTIEHLLGERPWAGFFRWWRDCSGYCCVPLRSPIRSQAPPKASSVDLAQLLFIEGSHLTRRLARHAGFGIKGLAPWPPGFPGGSDGKESACSTGDLGSIPGLGRFPWKMAWQPTPVFLPGESPWTEKPGRLQSMGLQRVRHK